MSCYFFFLFAKIQKFQRKKSEGIFVVYFSSDLNSLFVEVERKIFDAILKQYRYHAKYNVIILYK